MVPQTMAGYSPTGNGDVLSQVNDLLYLCDAVSVTMAVPARRAKVKFTSSLVLE